MIPSAVSGGLGQAQVFFLQNSSIEKSTMPVLFVETQLKLVKSFL